MSRRHHKGFTLIELMVTLSIAAILIAVAAPSFRELSVRNRLVTYTNDFISTVNFARSEAVRRAAPISICSSDNGTACGGTWSDGWIVFHNDDGDSPAAVDGGETILKVHDRLAGSYTIGANAALADDVTFVADGTARASGVLAVCHDGSLTGSRAIAVTALRPRVTKDIDNNGIPNKDDGTDIAACDDP